jgi:hypothetical protein
MNFERDVSLQDRQRIPHSVAGNAAANREQLLDEGHHRLSVDLGNGCTFVSQARVLLNYAQKLSRNEGSTTVRWLTRDLDTDNR